LSDIDWKCKRHSREEASKLGKELVKQGAVVASGHWRKRAAERSFTLPDCLNAIQMGTVIQDPDFEKGSWRYRFETRKLWVVLGFDEAGKVAVLVTAQWIKEGRRL
jgi:hypothetical protein